MEKTAKHPPPPHEVEEIVNLLREIQQKFNNFAVKFFSPTFYKVEDPVKQAPPPHGVEDIASVLKRNSAKIQ